MKRTITVDVASKADAQRLEHALTDPMVRDLGVWIGRLEADQDNRENRRDLRAVTRSLGHLHARLERGQS